MSGFRMYGMWNISGTARLLMAGALAASLGACATAGGTTGTSGSVDWTSIIQQAQSTAKGICAFVPTASTVSSIVISLVGGAGAAATQQVAAQAAQAFCDGIDGSKPRLARRTGPWKGAARPLLDFGSTTINGRIVHLQGYSG